MVYTSISRVRNGFYLQVIDGVRRMTPYKDVAEVIAALEAEMLSENTVMAYVAVNKNWPQL